MAADHLEVLGDDEQQPREDEADQGGDQAVPAEAGGAQQVGGDQWVGAAALAPDQQDQQRNGAGEGGHHQRVAPAAPRALDQAADQRAEAADAQRGAARVDAGGGGVPGLGEQEEAGGDAEGGQWHVEQEDRAPPVVVQQHAADQRPQRHARGQRGGDGGDGPGTFLGAEEGREDGERERRDQGRAQAHEDAGGDQRSRRAGEGAQDGGRQQDPEAHDEHAAPAEPVAEEPGRDHRGGEDDEERVDDPLLLTGRRVQFDGEGGQRDVEDRGVEAEHQDGDGQGGERPPAARVGGCRTVHGRLRVPRVTVELTVIPKSE